MPIAALTRAIAAHPDSLPLYFARGELRRVEGDLAGARADYAEVERLDPPHRELPLARAALALDAGEPATARRLLDATLAAHPAEVRALLLRSRAHRALGRRTAAIADLGAAIALAGSPDPDLVLERARLQVAEGDRAGARAGLAEARSRLGAVATIELFAIELDLADGRPVAARERLEALGARYPDRAPLAGLGARIAAAGGGSAGEVGRAGDGAGPSAASAGEGRESPAPAIDAVQSPPRSADPARGARVARALVAELTRGPYLQVGTPSAVTVRWRTSLAVDSRVRYGTSPGTLTSEASHLAFTTEHEVRVTGLLPGTRHYYSVGTATDTLAGDSSYTFRTAPEEGTAPPVRAWVIGDSGSPTPEAFAVRDAYAAWTGARGTDLWLMLGDNAYGSGTDSQYQTAVFDQYPAMLRQSVLWPTRGNHDVIHSGSNNDYYEIFTMPAAGEAGGVVSGSEAYYSFDWANIHLICLDSQGSSRAPGGAMLTWLANDLAANTRPWVIAFWHHPPYSKGSHDSDDESQLIDMRQNALPVLEAGGVDLVLTGHSHSYERSFLLDGHYGLSTTLNGAMIVDGGDGRTDGDGAYVKPEDAPWPNAGAVYAVAGSACQTGGGPLDHPVMVTSLDLWGSMVLDVDQDRLDARFLSHTGAVLDSFTILKNGVTGVAEGQAAAPGFRLGPGLPNPFTLDLRMSFALDRAGHVRLSVHDASGRRVATLAEGWRPAGTHEVRWDGRDAAGRAMPNGVYLAMLETHGARASRKVALVR